MPAAGAMAASAVSGGRRWLGVRYRWLRNLPDRLRHARRHAMALAAAARRPRPADVLVICYGNVCRSPYLEAVLRRELAARGLASVQVHSAGFVGPDRGVPDESRAVASTRGLDLAPHRSRLVTVDMMRTVQLAIVMSTEQLVRLRDATGYAGPVVLAGDLDPGPIATRAVRDPWGGDEAAFRDVFTRLDRCAVTLAEALASAPAAE